MYSLAILTVTAFVLSLVLTPLVRDWSVRIGLVDRPDHKRKIHSTATPRTGGIAILGAYCGAYALLLLLRVQGRSLVAEHFADIARLLPAVAIVFFTGLLDDWLNLRPGQKLAGQVAASAWAWFAGVRIAAVAGVETAPWLSFLLTVAWLILCSNAFNLIDGVDGLAAGVGLAATVTILIAGMFHGDISLGLATAPLAACLLGFLRYNFNPASIFLGDSGSLVIGFLLGCYGVIWSQKSATMLGVAAPVMALALPLLEVLISILRRFLRNEPIFSADRGHIHHQLLDRGFTPRRVALLLYGVCGVGAALSLAQSLLNHNGIGGIAILLFVTVTCFGVRYLSYAEFAATARFLWAGLRPMLGAQVKIELFERELDSARGIEECWQALERAARSLGYSHITARLGDARFSAAADRDHAAAFWQMRLNLSQECWVNISQTAGGEQPMLLIPFAGVVRRVLPAKLERLREDQGTPRNSRTTTVISSDCDAPPVNAATAF